MDIEKLIADLLVACAGNRNNIIVNRFQIL